MNPLNHCNRDEIIQRLLPKVERTVATYLRNYPQLAGEREDLISVGTVKLIEAVDKFLGKKPEKVNHLANYVRISVLTGITDYVRKSGKVKTRRSKTLLTRLKADPIDERALYEGLNREDLTKAAKTPEDSVLVAMVLRGNAKKEIAATLCVTQKEVKRRLLVLVESVKNG